MDKMINEIILNSMSFDDNVKSNTFCKLSELHENIKNDIYDFGLLIQLKELDMEDLYIVLKKIIKTNELILNKIKSEKNIKSEIDITKKTIILFYKTDCDISQAFLKNWFKLKMLYKSKYNFLTVNIDVPRYKKLIEIFDIKSTSLVCLVNNEFYVYSGKIDIDFIAKFLNDI